MDTALEISEDEQKQAYALAYLRNPEDPFKAAIQVFPTDTAKALAVSREWPHDPTVIEAQETALDSVGEEGFLPSKAELVREAWRKVQVTDAETAFKGIKLIADMMGYIDKPGTTVNNNTLVDNRRVMVVKDHGTDDEWEAAAKAQQARLIEDAR